MFGIIQNISFTKGAGNKKATKDFKLDPLKPKMAFLFGFGPSKAPKSRFEVSVSDIVPQAAARSDLEIPGNPASLPALALPALAWPVLACLVSRNFWI